MNLTHLLTTYGVWIIGLAVIAGIYFSARRRSGDPMKAVAWDAGTQGAREQDIPHARNASELPAGGEPRPHSGNAGLQPRPTDPHAGDRRHHGCC